MRSICLAFVLFVLSYNSFSQNRKGFRHIIKQSSVESGYLPLAYLMNKDTIPIRICSPQLEGIISMVSGVPTIDFFTIIDTAHISSPDCISRNTKLGSFILNLRRTTLGDSTRVIRVPFRTRSWSIATVPFRYRFKSDSAFSTVTSNLSVSFSYGWATGYSTITHRGMNNYSVTLGPFIGFSSADLKRSTVKKPASWAADRTNIALSYRGSVTLARNNFGLVLSFGLDHAFGKNSKQWSYQDKPWIGLGVNTSLGLF